MFDGIVYAAKFAPVGLAIGFVSAFFIFTLEMPLAGITIGTIGIIVAGLLMNDISG